MKYTATELRKTLFTALDKAASGEPVEIQYKGKNFRLTADLSGSKLARIKRQYALLVPPESIADSDPEMLAEMEAEWEEDWKEI
jgi:hypothetical protein